MPDEVDPYSYVWSLNGERRDLNMDQRYLIWKACSEKSEAWLSEQQRIKDEANRKRAEAANAKPRTETGVFIKLNTEENPAPHQKQPVVPQIVGTPVKPLPNKNKTNQAKATASNTNRGSVERMDRLVKVRPDLAEKVKQGEVKPTDAIREMKRDIIITNLEDIKAKEVKAASGVYDVIVIDPPWPMQKIERDERPNQSEFDYPTMSENDLLNLKIPYADDCHVWLWTTHKFLPLAFKMLDWWKMKYVCTFVWHKPGGFQVVGLPQYNCEFALYARIGSPGFIDTKAFPVCFDAQRGRHSEKPDAFYETVKRVP